MQQTSHGLLLVSLSTLRHYPLKIDDNFLSNVLALFQSRMSVGGADQSERTR